MAKALSEIVPERDLVQEVAAQAVQVRDQERKLGLKGGGIVDQSSTLNMGKKGNGKGR